MTITHLTVYALLIAAMFSSSCKEDVTTAAEANKPKVKVFLPSGNIIKDDSTIIAIDASDDKGVTKVELYLNAKMIATLFHAPYSYVWHVDTVQENSNHTLFAKAYDSDDHVTESAVLNVQIEKHKPSGLKIHSLFPDSVNLSWTDISKNESEYIIETSSNGGVTYNKIKTLSANTVSAVVTSSFIVNSLYHFRVAAKIDSNFFYSTSVSAKCLPLFNIFTSRNMKSIPVYFSFAAKDSVASTSSWDLKLTTVYPPDDSLRQFPFPGIVLNSALNVTGTFVDVKYENVDPVSVAGLTKDVLDTLVTDSTRNIKTSPIYYSFDKHDTTTVDGTWDIKFTVNASMEPIIVLNKSKGVTGKVLDATPFPTLLAATVPNLESDVNDTTLVIGNKCFQYAGPPTHKLNPVVNRTFVVRTIKGARAKFQMLNYYNANGSSGYIRFQYVAPEWYSIGSFCLKYAGAPTHKVNPYPDRTFVVKTSSGTFAKFKMLTYYNDAGASGFMKFQYNIK